MHPAFLYSPGDRLSQAELSAARLDGDVVEVGDVYAPADLIETPALRAAAIAEARAGHESLAFAGASAAWIHGAGAAPPHRHEVQRTGATRVRIAPSARLLLHDVALDDEDVMRIDGILVTTPARTLLDLLRWVRHDPAHATWAHRLAAARPDILDTVAELLEQYRRRPGHLRAAALLAELQRDAENAVIRTR